PGPKRETTPGAEAPVPPPSQATAPKPPGPAAQAPGPLAMRTPGEERAGAPAGRAEVPRPSEAAPEGAREHSPEGVLPEAGARRGSADPRGAPRGGQQAKDDLIPAGRQLERSTSCSRGQPAASP